MNSLECKGLTKTSLAFVSCCSSCFGRCEYHFRHSIGRSSDCITFSFQETAFFDSDHFLHSLPSGYDLSCDFTTPNRHASHVHPFLVTTSATQDTNFPPHKNFL